MGKLGRCLLATAAAALTGTATGWAGTYVSVGYTAPSDLHGLRVVARVPPLRVAEVRIPGAAAARALRRRPGIRFVQRTVPRTEAGGPTFAVPEWQWLAAHADTVPSSVSAAASAVTIAVVDTGADTTVPSLAAKSPVTWNVATGSSTVHDAIGHGTFVASLAAGAATEAGGLVGFGGDARLMIVQANRGGTTFSDIDEASGIQWAVDHGAKIINLSLGGSSTSSVERAAIDYAISKGVLLVAAAGNSAEDGNPTTYPAALIGRKGLVVGAADARGARAPFSSTGAYVDVLAPGVDVVGALSPALNTNFFTPFSAPGLTGSYGIGSGTSYAAPEVAGAAALVWAANPLLSAADVAATIESAASGHGVWTQDLAWGNLDVAAAVARAAAGTPPQLTLPVTQAKPKLLRPQKRAKVAPAGKRPKRARP